jgi:hypothetical protein
MHFGIKLLTWVREYSSWRHPLPQNCLNMRKHTRSNKFTMKDPQVYSSGNMKNPSAMDQENEVEINLTSKQFLIPKNFVVCPIKTRKQLQ